MRDMIDHYFLHAADDVLTGVEYLVKKGIAEPIGSEPWDGVLEDT